MKYIYLLTVLTLMFSCKQQDKKTKNEVEKNTISDSTTKRDTLNQEPYNRVISFLKWYKKNYEEVNKFGLVNNATLEDYDSTKYYSVNQEQTEAYLEKIKSSGFVSENYINEWRKYFKICDNDFKKNPQNDGPPEGFDYDFILQTQEIDETLNAIEKPKMIYSKISKNKATVEIDIMMILTFDLSKINGIWLIDKGGYYKMK